MSDILAKVYSRHFKKSFSSYKSVHRFVMGGRWPYTVGRQHTQSFRLMAVKSTDPDQKDPSIDVWVDRTKIAVFHPDDTVEFTATPDDVWRYNYTLAGNIHKVIPVFLYRKGTGRYWVAPPDEIVKSEQDRNRTPVRSKWHHKARREMDKQEYFQHLRLDLNTGKIVNPKDMHDAVNEEKRKEWTSGLKQARLKLRAQSRVGALEHYKDSDYHYLSPDRVKYIAENIMRGSLDQTAQLYLAQSVASWKRRRYASVGESILYAFETAIKTHSHTMRVCVGVLDTPKP